MLATKQYIEDRVERIPESGCWIWTGGLDHYGYGQAGKRGLETRKAHRLSWIAYHGPIPDGMLICHRCDICACVNPDHLFIGSSSDNLSDMHAKKRHPHGERSGVAKLTNEQVIAIATDTDHLQSELAEMFGVTQVTISRIKTGYCWAHLSSKKWQAGKKRLTPTVVRAIRAATGTQQAIAKNYGVSRALVGLIRQGNAWRDV